MWKRYPLNRVSHRTTGEIFPYVPPQSLMMAQMRQTWSAMNGECSLWRMFSTKIFCALVMQFFVALQLVLKCHLMGCHWDVQKWNFSKTGFCANVWSWSFFSNWIVCFQNSKCNSIIWKIQCMHAFFSSFFAFEQLENVIAHASNFWQLQQLEKSSENKQRFDTDHFSKAPIEQKCINSSFKKHDPLPLAKNDCHTKNHALMQTNTNFENG